MKRAIFLLVFAMVIVYVAVRLRPSVLDFTTNVSAETEGSPPKYKVPAAFFGLNINVQVTQNQPWPEIPFGSYRFWDSATGWAQLNPAKGKYDFSQVDKWVSALKAHNIDDALFTFGRVPNFASSKPNDKSCAYGPGQCDPPSDLNADGSGSDQYWKDFVTALATHNKNSKTFHIKYWEIWNESFSPNFWTGNVTQLVRMASDAYEILHRIDPDAVVVSPCAPVRYPRYAQFMVDYWAAGGGKYADVIAVHGYIHARPGVAPVATDFTKYLADVRKALAQYGLNSKPLWDTEASWGNTGTFLPDEDMQAAFLAQFYLIHWSQGVERLYWYAYNNGEVGGLWIPDAGNSSRGRITKAAIAYGEVYNWLVGATMTRPCTQEGSLWTCGITKPDGNEAQIVWSVDREQPYTPKQAFSRMRNLDKTINTISGAVKVGPKPILLEAKQ